jgi:hypothetical protein
MVYEFEGDGGSALLFELCAGERKCSAKAKVLDGGG